VSAVSANTSLGADLSMTAELTDVVIASVLPSVHDVPLAINVIIDHNEYALIMRSIVGGNSAAQVSAFNSCI
jgi:hypothetical protein